MFTLKFQKYLEHSEQSTTDVISAHRYERTDLSDGTIIMVHTTADEPNIEYRINADHQKTHSFETCYIENINGKTIDKVGPIKTQKAFHYLYKCDECNHKWDKKLKDHETPKELYCPECKNPHIKVYDCNDPTTNHREKLC